MAEQFVNLEQNFGGIAKHLFKKLPQKHQEKPLC